MSSRSNGSTVNERENRKAMLKKSGSIRSADRLRKCFAKILPKVPRKNNGEPNLGKAYARTARRMGCSKDKVRKIIKEYGYYAR